MAAMRLAVMTTFGKFWKGVLNLLSGRMDFGRLQEYFRKENGNLANKCVFWGDISSENAKTYFRNKKKWEVESKLKVTTVYYILFNFDCKIHEQFTWVMVYVTGELPCRCSDLTFAGAWFIKCQFSNIHKRIIWEKKFGLTWTCEIAFLSNCLIGM